MDVQPKLDTAVRWLQEADGLLITAGAGMGVDSGLPDFRGTDGFWRAYPALRKHRMSFEDIANPAGFERYPTLAWGFYGHRLALYRSTVPHAGFQILLAWAKRMSHGAFVYTSNVDGQFQKAGFAPDRVAECHGTIHSLQCVEACTAKTWSAASFEPVVNDETSRLLNDIPRCSRCGRLARPNILMFGDWNWVDRESESQLVRLENWISKVERPVVVELGAGGALPTVRRFSERHGPRVIRINPREFKIAPHLGVGVQGGALGTLRTLDALLEPYGRQQA
jgi:NAD-dependent SIR2 family protein deacetylase